MRRLSYAIRFLFFVSAGLLILTIAGFALGGCTTVSPIARDVCDVASDVCEWQELLCSDSLLFRTPYSREQILDSLAALGVEMKLAVEASEAR